MNKEKQKRLGKLFGISIIIIMFTALGFILGMATQQAITQSTLIKVADSLDGVQIDIDLNETEIITGITEFWKPYIEESLNKSEDDANVSGEEQ
jgi:hypothetical protein